MSDKRLSARAVDEKVADLAGKLDRVVDSTNDALASVTEKLDRLMAAINNPVIITKGVDAAAQDDAKLGAAGFSDDGVLERARLMDVASPEFREKAEMLEFMNELVEIEINEVSDRDAAATFMVSVNGKGKVFHRGWRGSVPRYYVEVLARARPVHYANQEFVDGDGTRKVRYPARRGLLYPFSVIRDSDRGKQWLRERLRAA